MRICFISDYSGRTDEGVTNTAFYLDRELSRRHQVLHLCLKPYGHLLLPGFWRAVKAFQPQIIHFIPGPTLKCFSLVKALKVYYPRAKTVMSATHPALSPLSQRLIPWLKPDLILAQSPESEAMFRHWGCSTRLLPSGVDTQRFAPVSPERKQELRQKFHLEERRWVVLHVGPIKGGRNLLLLNQIQQEPDTQIVIVGSLTVPTEWGVYRRLVKGGCLVWRTYFQNIAEVYALSDCYIFPTWDRLNSIEFPLSVMEAMACNLPVLSTPFVALPYWFTPGDGLSFVSKEEDFLPLLRRLKTGAMECKTREKVLAYSWERVAGSLEQLYQEVLG